MVIAAGTVVTCAFAAIACSLNPQPLPPEQPFPDGTSFAEDASSPRFGGADAGSQASLDGSSPDSTVRTPPTDAADGGAQDDAEAPSPDAGSIDAADARVDAESVDAEIDAESDGAADDGTHDASDDAIVTASDAGAE